MGTARSRNSLHGWIQLPRNSYDHRRSTRETAIDPSILPAPSVIWRRMQRDWAGFLVLVLPGRSTKGVHRNGERLYQPTKRPTESDHITSGDQSYQKLLNRRPHVFTNDIAAT